MLFNWFEVIVRWEGQQKMKWFISESWKKPFIFCKLIPRVRTPIGNESVVKSLLWSVQKAFLLLFPFRQREETAQNKKETSSLFTYQKSLPCQQLQNVSSFYFSKCDDFHFMPHTWIKEYMTLHVNKFLFRAFLPLTTCYKLLTC